VTGPLDGIRVVDLTVAWSGPGATALLGDLGAEVIRVEGNDRPSRQVSASLTKEAVRNSWQGATFPDRDPGARPYDRYAVFNWHARNKLSVCMNLDTPEGHAAALKLLQISDVFVENNARGTLEKLGLGHNELLELNPRLIVARMPPLGMSGPMSDYLGYGPNFNALVGISAIDGYEGEGPESAGDNNHMDEVSPASLAFSVIAALWDRERTGQGGLIEFSQAENLMQNMGEAYLDWQMNRRLPPIRGNSDAHFLQDVFPAKEDDRWVAISIRDDRDWQGLKSVIGDAPWLADGDDAELRAANSVELRRALSEWTQSRSSDEIVLALQARGVPAGEVMSESRLLADEHLRARQWFRERTHPSVGTHRYPGWPWRASGLDLAYGRPLPGFGEDNEYVYKALLGYSDDEYESLRERSLVTDAQLA